MKRYYIASTIAFILIAAATQRVAAQAGYLPYSFHFYQQLNKEIYDPNTRVHSSLKPFYIKEDSVITRATDSLLNRGVDSSRHGWISRKLFNEHLFQVNKDDYTFYGDFLPDFIIGRDFSGKKTTWQNTRGYQFGGTVGKKFSFYTSGYENQGKFPKYYQDFSEKYTIVPGQTNEFFGRRQEQKDWQYVTANISYTPADFINISLALDKIFIGDGYRSLLLSDATSPYPFIKITGNYKNIQYTGVWASLQDPSAPAYSYETGNRRKGAVFHYLDWNITPRLSLGFFDALIWEVKNEAGSKDGLKAQYINPIIFLNSAISSGSENSVVGFTGKYELLDKTTLYGQLVLDGIKNDSKDLWGLQAGIKGTDLAGAEALTYILEYNTVKPYTFAQTNRVINYAHYNQPLGHLYGANFREMLGILGYTYKRFGFTAEALFSRYGLDRNDVNYGKDIFHTTSIGGAGTSTGQGLSTDLYYLDGRVSYLLNPKYNLRFEVGGVFRKEKNSIGNNNTTWMTFGLRSSFRNLYQDF
ncbi:gliding motility protein RemB [Arcticibacter tournemirensis]|uniref:Gliding motility protein RemB n=1 Tax=Arcticibacter tournemirensis TaxID=699437 RepID=A0A4Q0M9A9_9SPHI|nr:gliding motility protein RemB [Arcticibacter tournemirensis]RXF69349.1 gliding motility protein RemB [Arcticibacter tournemirensis]